MPLLSVTAEPTAVPSSVKATVLPAIPWLVVDEVRVALNVAVPPSAAVPETSPSEVVVLLTVWVKVEEMLKKEGKKLSELARQLLSNNSGQLEKMIREAARAVRLSNIERTIEENYFARALARQLGLEQIEQEIKELREQLEKMEVGGAFKARVRTMGIRDRPASFRSPWQNGMLNA